MRIKTVFRKMLAVAIVAGTFAVMPLASAEVKEYEGFGEYVMSDFETPDVAKQRAKARAEQNAMEQAGVYLESRTEVVNSRITRDEIKTITNGILNVINVKYDLRPIAEEGGSFLVAARIIATIETDEIQKWLQRDAAEKEELVKQNKGLEKINAKQEQEIANLKQQIAKTKNVDDKNILKIKIENADIKFLAKQKIKEGLRKFYTRDMNGAIALFSKAIEIDPSYAEAYRRRGYIYIYLHKNTEAIADFTSAIKVAPNDVQSYLTRGMELWFMGNKEAGMNDFNTAIAINPNSADAYSWRGDAYSMDNDYKQAIADFTVAIHLEPKEAERYSRRASEYESSGKFEQAIADYSIAIQLKPTWSYYQSRGDLYCRMEQYLLAITDYTIAIGLFTTDIRYNKILAKIYNSRGFGHWHLGNFEQAIDDFSNAINLNPNEGAYYYHRGFVYKDMGDYSKKESDFAKGRELAERAKDHKKNK